MWRGAVPFLGQMHEVHVALDLVEELLARVVVEVVAARLPPPTIMTIMSASRQICLLATGGGVSSARRWSEIHCVRGERSASRCVGSGRSRASRTSSFVVASSCMGCLRLIRLCGPQPGLNRYRAGQRSCCDHGVERALGVGEKCLVSRVRLASVIKRGR